MDGWMGMESCIFVFDLDLNYFHNDFEIWHYKTDIQSTA